MIGNVLDGIGGKGLETALSSVDVTEVPQVRGFVMMLALVEKRNIEATAHLLDAVDSDAEMQIPDIETRQEQLLDVFDAAMSQQLDQWWLDNVAADHMDNVEQAADLLGIGTESEAWDQQKQEWRQTHVEAGTVEPDESTEAITQRHVQAVFDVSLDRFEEEVIDWNEQEQLQSLLVGPLQSNAVTIDQLADHFEAAEESSQEGE